MKHVSIDDLRHVAEVNSAPKRPLTPQERLNRWADLLDLRGGERFATLPGTEYARPQMRDAMRTPNSPLSVAFEDPELRADGLTGDTYGAARRYFGLGHWQLHDIVCHCHSGASVSGGTAARRVRALAGHWRPGFLMRARQLLFG